MALAANFRGKAAGTRLPEDQSQEFRQDRPRRHGSKAGYTSGWLGSTPEGRRPQIRGFRAGSWLAVASSTPATQLLSPAKMLKLNHARFRVTTEAKAEGATHFLAQRIRGWPPMSPLATVLPLHASRSTIVGVHRRCRAPSWLQHSPPGRGQHATTCYVFRSRQKFCELCFRRKLIYNFVLRPFLS